MIYRPNNSPEPPPIGVSVPHSRLNEDFDACHFAGCQHRWRWFILALICQSDLTCGVAQFCSLGHKITF